MALRSTDSANQYLRLSAVVSFRGSECSSPILLVFPCPSASVVVVVVFGSNVAIADVIGEGNTGSVAVVVGSNVAIDEGNNVVVVVDVVSGSVVVGSNVATAAAVVVVCVVVESK